MLLPRRDLRKTAAQRSTGDEVITVLLAPWTRPRDRPRVGGRRDGPVYLTAEAVPGPARRRPDRPARGSRRSGRRRARRLRPAGGWWHEACGADGLLVRRRAPGHTASDGGAASQAAAGLRRRSCWRARMRVRSIRWVTGCVAAISIALL